MSARFIALYDAETEPFGDDWYLAGLWHRLKTFAAWKPYETIWGRGTLQRNVRVGIDQLIVVQETWADHFGVSRKVLRRWFDQLVELGRARLDPIMAGGRSIGTLVTVFSHAAVAAARPDHSRDHSPPPQDSDRVSVLEGVRAVGTIPGPGVLEQKQLEPKKPLPPNPPAPSPAPPPPEPDGEGGGSESQGELVVPGRPPDPDLRAEVQAILGIPLTSPAAAAAFDREWAETSGTREALIDEARWIAAQPQLDRSSSITRVFHTGWLRRMVAKRRRNLEAWALEALRCGASPDELAAGFEVADDFDEGRVRALVLEVARRLEPEARARGRL